LWKKEAQKFEPLLYFPQKCPKENNRPMGTEVAQPGHPDYVLEISQQKLSDVSSSRNAGLETAWKVPEASFVKQIFEPVQGKVCA
jgi:hypothetical protein